MNGTDAGNNSGNKSIIGAAAQNHKKSASFNLDPEIITTASTSDHSYDPNLKVTLETRDDAVPVHSIQTGTEGGGGEGEGEGEGDEDAEMVMLESKQSAVGSSSLSESTSGQHIKSFGSLSNISNTTSLSSWKRFEPVADALQGLKFITTESGDERNDWSAVKKRFDELTASAEGRLHYSKFGECIGIKGDTTNFTNELFWTVARKHKIKGEYINIKQLKELWRQIYDESFGSRLKTFFDMVDKDEDGKITKDEIKEIISLSASTNKLPNIQKQAEEYAAVIMEVLDPHKDGHIKIQKLEKMLLQTPKKFEKALQELNPTHEKNPLMRWYQKVKYFLINHWKKVWVLMLWLGIISGLFAYKFVQYRNKAVYHVMGNCVCIAKGAAETLKFNMALILLPVCRKTITWLRNKTKFGVVVPFDNNLDFHMVIAAGIAIGVILHGGAHLICDFPRLIHATNEEYKPMKPCFGEKQPQNYWWFVKGVEGVTGIIMVVLMSIAFTLANPWFRRNKLKEKLEKKHKTMPKLFERLTGFNAFWYSHHLFVIVYVLLVVHGIYLYLIKSWYQKTTWMYVMVPVILYACERLIRIFRSNIEPVRVRKAIVDNDVLALHMSKPKDFIYESGQYIFIKCSEVSPFEWHPFSITSAPGDDYLSVHIRKLGDWTGRINTVFSDSVKGGSNLWPKIKIDGPYGSPARDYKDYDVVLLIGLGIGATPMISVVKDIINNIQRQEDNLESGLANGNYKTKKVYFYWVTNKQSSFNWFKEIMNEVAEVDKTGRIELHNYCSSVFEEGDARSAMISVLQSLHHAKKGVDVVSETRVKCHFGKPNWHRVYKNIASHHPNSTIGVFYCGNSRSIKELRQLANLESSDKATGSIFEFHKENF